MADRHVYANPTYLSHFEANSANPNWAQTASNNAATMQIGGLPFYLPKDASEPTRENIPDLGKQTFFSENIQFRLPVNKYYSSVFNKQAGLNKRAGY